MGKLYDESSRTILGLKPAHFVTMATPHLGVDGNGLTQVPLLGWAGDVPFIGSSIQKLMISMACPVTSMLFGKSGQQFFLQVVPRTHALAQGAQSRCYGLDFPGLLAIGWQRAWAVH